MAHTRARITALAITTALALTACSSDGGGDKEPAAAAPTVNCQDPNTDMSKWTAFCGPGSGMTTDAPTAPAAPLQIDQPATTAGATSPIRGPGGGILEITPVAVVYRATDNSYTPDNGLFLTVGFKHRAADGTPAPTAPIDGGGWKYIAPDGQALEQGNGRSAFSVVANSFNDPGPVATGTFVYDADTWDISEAQRGGVIVYTDGAGQTHRWQVPAQDGGSEAEKLKRDLD